MAQEPHLDDVPYVEQSGHEEQLGSSLEVIGNKEHPVLKWVCPICHGAPQLEPLEATDLQAIDIVTQLPPVELKCQCGHLHKEKQGCGFASQVSVPLSALPG